MESQLTDFTEFCESRTGQRFPDHAAFHAFSVAEYPRFWSLFLEWSQLVHEGSAEPACTDERVEFAGFFPNVSLSYAENLLRPQPGTRDEDVAVVAHHAYRPRESISRAELRGRVRRLAWQLRSLGVVPGDNVVAVAGNNIEVLVGGLATTAVGAAFSSASPDMGVPALLSRFGQLAPKILMANLVEGGEAASTALSDRMGELMRGLPSLIAAIALDDGADPRQTPLPIERLAELCARDEADDGGGDWPRFPFNHPLFTLFSSGTTGAPKGIVHGAGGTLLEHLKEHRLHVDLRPGDKLLFHTSAAWMMWNWQLSALASGCSLVLYDGPLSGPDALWRVVSSERVTVFGTSPTYLQLCQDRDFAPRSELPLESLRTVLSTGSILHDWQYDWVREKVGALPLQSISGGTDIIGCFVLGNPNLPVRRGWIQCRSLGLDVQAVDGSAGAPGPTTGELVCRNPFPSRPLGFVDDDGARFHDAYFRANPGVWTHGDLIEFDAEGQARMHGRSDGVLHIHGVRIGPAEIYRALRDVHEVSEAMAVEQRAAGSLADPGVVLLVVLHEPSVLDGRLTIKIRRAIVAHASPMHVPDLVVQVRELPTTHSGKRSERSVRDVVNGLPAGNRESLANPGCLDEIRRAVAIALERRRELAGAAEQASAGSTESRLRAIWEGVLGVAPLRSDDNFFDVGGGSLAAVRLFHAIHDHMGVDLPLSTLVRAQTPADMAAVIDSPAELRVPSAVLLRPGTASRPLFLVHSVSGDVLQLRPLALALETDRPVYGIQARGLDPAETPQTRVDEMAASYVHTVRSLQATGPYDLAGHSFGGLVAFEMARILARQGERVGWLGLIDTEVHHACLHWPARVRFALARPFRYIGAVLRSPRRRLPRYLPKALLRVAPWAPVAEPPPEWPLPPLLHQLERISMEAFASYRPGPFPGSATLFLAGDREPARCDPLPVWRAVVGGPLAVVEIPGGHVDAIVEPHVGALAKRLSVHLQDQGRHRSS